MDIEKESSDKTLISYRPPGEIARRFHLDNSSIHVDLDDDRRWADSCHRNVEHIYLQIGL